MLKVFSSQRDFSGSQFPFSQEAATRQIEVRFVERVVWAAANSVTAAAKQSGARHDKTLMRAIEKGTFDVQIANAVKNIEPAQLRPFDEAEPFSYPDWAARKLKD